MIKGSLQINLATRDPGKVDRFRADLHPELKTDFAPAFEDTVKTPLNDRDCGMAPPSWYKPNAECGILHKGS